MMQRKEKVRDNLWNIYHRSISTSQKTHDFHLKLSIAFVFCKYY